MEREGRALLTFTRDEVNTGGYQSGKFDDAKSALADTTRVLPSRFQMCGVSPLYIYVYIYIKKLLPKVTRVHAGVVKAEDR